MTLSNPILEKVFLSLRPNFFPEYHKEHITLRYYNRVRWDVLMQDCGRMEKDLPATISPLIYSSWKSNVDGKSFQGLLVESKGSGILDHLEMPHITLPDDHVFDAGVPWGLEPQIVDTLWLGKKIEGRLIWAKYDTRSLGLNHERIQQFPHSPESVPPVYESSSLPL